VQREVLIVAGEASGDQYAAELVREARRLDPDLGFFGLGGDAMSEAGVEILRHIREVQVMGFVEVIARLGRLYRTFSSLGEAARRRRPRAVVLVDFPDFNLRLAGRLRGLVDAPILYYIGPTVWAWRPGRIKTIRRVIDRMLVIFPFEEAIYRRAGVPVDYVGHPLVGSVVATTDAADFRQAHGLPSDVPLVGLLPGSRHHEVQCILPVMREATRLLAGRRAVAFALGLARTIEQSEVEPLLRGDPPVVLVRNQTHDLMAHADVVLVGCGTAPLETALLGTPMVVVYRTQELNFELVSRLVKVSHACIVNLIPGRTVVPELLQASFTPDRAVHELERLLSDQAAAGAQRQAFRELAERLGVPGAAARAARRVVEAAAAGRRPALGVA
jgi:lipid-A-disaccharide synthase